MINLENFADKINNKLENSVDWKALHHLSMMLLKPDTIQQKLERVLQTVAEFHNTPYGLVSFFDPITGTLAVKASIGLNNAAVAAVEGIKPGQGCCGFSFAEQRRTIIDDFQINEQFAEFRPWASQHSIRAVYSTPFYDARGEVMGVLSVYFDKPHTPTLREQELADICATTVALILDRERTEIALRRERDRRDHVLRGMGEGFCILDRNFNVLEMNAAGLRIDKRSFHEIVGQNYWTLWPEMDPQTSRQLRKAMTERITVHLENRVKNAAGQIFWFAISAHSIDEGLALFFRDITERKKTEEAVQDSEMRYRLLSESISTFVWRTDAQGIVIDSGESWNRYTGHDGDPQEWYEVVHPDDRENTRKSWEAILASGQASQFTCRVLRRDGMYRYLITHAVPWMDSAGNVKEWVGSCEDITEASLYEEKLRQENHRKDQFLAVLSHELRNPLSAAKMAVELLGTPPVKAERVNQLSEVIKRQVGHMSRLVEDMIDVTRVSQGLVVLDKHRVNLNTIIENAQEQVSPMMVAKGHTLEIEVPPYPCEVYGDRIRLVQVIANLLSNAARYTPQQGCIHLTLAPKQDCFSVKIVDNGIGIEPNVILGLFDLFAQAERSTDPKTGGLGLGLALVKSLVELHGGTVTAKSDGRDLGSTFTVTLPRLVQEQES